MIGDVVAKNLMICLIIDFSNNINSNADTIFIPEILTAGLPDDYKVRHKQNDGLYAIDLSYPSFYTFMENAHSDSLRKLIRLKFLNIGYPDNLELLDEIIIKRDKMAKILGYPSYAAYIIEESMAKPPHAVWSFENNLRKKIATKAYLDSLEMLSMKRDLFGQDIDIVYDWDKHYIENQILIDRYSVESEKVKEYFEINNVINGVFTITSLLFDLEYVEVINPSGYHIEVLVVFIVDYIRISLKVWL